MWIYYGLLAAVFLGFYNICKKMSVTGNAVLPVLWISTAGGLVTVLPFFIISRVNPAWAQEAKIFIPELSFTNHALLAAKSLLMAASWYMAFHALKHLPITIVSPIRSAGPFFTLLGAIFIYGEHPLPLQWLGFAFIILSMLMYSKVGKLEGIDFLRDRWIYAIIFATFLGACSGLYDKYLVQSCGFDAQTVQFWFSWYIVLILGIFLLIQQIIRGNSWQGFEWRWSVPLVGVLLMASDFLYLRALQQEGTLIVLLSALKRSQIFISVFIGGMIFKEKNKVKKLVPLIGVVIGLALILYAEHL